MEKEFWKSKSLKELSSKEWELLCDGCALCCLHKLEDEDTGEIYYTQVGCRYLNSDTAHCTCYNKRFSNVSSCLKVKPETRIMKMLPKTCAYRLVAEGKDLPDYHHLICGDPNKIHDAGVSCRGKAIPEDLVDMTELEEYVIYLLD